MEFLRSGLADDDIGGNLQILDPAGNVGIARGASRLAVILVIHGPAVEPVASEFIHDRIFAMPGHGEIESPGAHRGAVNEEQHRPRRLTGLGRAEPLAKHPQRNIAFLGPVFAAPDLAALRWRGTRALRRGGTRQSGDHAGTKSKAGAPDDRATRQRMIKICHGFLRSGFFVFFRHRRAQQPVWIPFDDADSNRRDVFPKAKMRGTAKSSYPDRAGKFAKRRQNSNRQASVPAIKPGCFLSRRPSATSPPRWRRQRHWRRRWPGSAGCNCGGDRRRNRRRWGRSGCRTPRWCRGCR
jgi:hypothetical protein